MDAQTDLPANQRRRQRRGGAKIGLALGGGSALGLAHIGALRALEEAGVAPDVVAGTSIGAVFGAAYVLGQLDPVEAAVRKVSWLEVMRLADVRFSKGGLLNGDAIVREIRRYIGDATFDDADRPFAVVASDLVRNEEVTLRSGSVAEALRASISIPGIFTPVQRDGRLLIDGGIKNPVPISVCHALGAEKVIAVDVTGDYEGQAIAAGIVSGEPFKGGLYEVVTVATSMIMNQLGAIASVENPADLVIVPMIGHVKPFQFGKGEHLIAAGYDAAREALAVADVDAW